MAPPTYSDKKGAQELYDRMYGQKEENPMALIDSTIQDLQRRFQEAIKNERRVAELNTRDARAQVTQLEGYLMELNLALSNVALAIASGNFEKVRACVEGLEKAQKPIDEYFRKKIDTKFDGDKTPENPWYGAAQSLGQSQSVTYAKALSGTAPTFQVGTTNVTSASDY